MFSGLFALGVYSELEREDGVLTFLPFGLLVELDGPF